MREIRTLKDLYPVDQFGNEPVEVSVSLAMGMAGHVHRNTVDANLKISSVIGIETTKKNLVRFSPSVMLANGQARHQPHDVAGCVRRAKLQIL